MGTDAFSRLCWCRTRCNWTIFMLFHYFHGATTVKPSNWVKPVRGIPLARHKCHTLPIACVVLSEAREAISRLHDATLTFNLIILITGSLFVWAVNYDTYKFILNSALKYFSRKTILKKYITVPEKCYN